MIILHRSLFAIILLPLIISHGVSAQDEGGVYKYFVVPHYFEFTSGENQFLLNSMTRYLLREKGFDALMEEEWKGHSDYQFNSCEAVNISVIRERSVLRTKLYLIFSNCRGEIILKSNEGSSKIKDLEKAYQDALKKAIASKDPFSVAKIILVCSLVLPKSSTELGDTFLKAKIGL